MCCGYLRVPSGRLTGLYRAGLDKITAQFQFVVGTLGFGAGSVFTSLSVAVILIGTIIHPAL